MYGGRRCMENTASEPFRRWPFSRGAGFIKITTYIHLVCVHFAPWLCAPPAKQAQIDNFSWKQNEKEVPVWAEEATAARVVEKISSCQSTYIITSCRQKFFSRAAHGVSDPEPPRRRLNCIMCAPLSGKNRSVDLLFLQNRMHKRQTAFIAATFGRLIFPYKTTFVQLTLRSFVLVMWLAANSWEKRPRSGYGFRTLQINRLKRIHPAAVRYRIRLAIFLISVMRV